jgi:hypothetical protein
MLGKRFRLETLMSTTMRRRLLDASLGALAMGAAVLIAGSSETCLVLLACIAIGAAWQTAIIWAFAPE